MKPTQSCASIFMKPPGAQRNNPSPPLGAERVGVRWESRVPNSRTTHLTLPAQRAGPLPLPPQAGGEGQGLAIRPVPAAHACMPQRLSGGDDTLLRLAATFRVSLSDVEQYPGGFLDAFLDPHQESHRFA